MKKAIPSTTLRANLSNAINAVALREKYLLITKKGKPVSALVNLDYFEDLLALSSPKYLKSIKEAREQYKKGEVYYHEEVFGEI